MHTLISVIHVVTCILLVLVVLLQSGKGAEISASFSGSSQTVFGSSGGANFFTRFTSVAAAIFFATSITLTLMGTDGKKSVFDGALGTGSAPTKSAPAVPVPASAPAAPAPAAADAKAPAAPAKK